MAVFTSEERTDGLAGLLDHHLILRQRHEDELLDGPHLPSYGRTVRGVLCNLACTHTARPT